MNRCSTAAPTAWPPPTATWPARRPRVVALDGGGERVGVEPDHLGQLGDGICLVVLVLLDLEHAEWALANNAYEAYMGEDPVTDTEMDDGLGHRMLCWAGPRG